MSSGTALPFAEAFKLAGPVAEELRPHVVRLEAAGSLRRRAPVVGDLEFVVEPRMVAADLFGTMAPDTEPIRKALFQMGSWVKGGKRFMQITDLLGLEGVTLDLFLVHPPAQWGSILAIRTGPWQLGRYCVTAMKERGYLHEEGHVVHMETGETVPTPTEEDFFGFAGVDFVLPAERDRLAMRLETRR